MHLLHHRCALPLLTQPAPRPHCTIDVGLHAAPVLPITTHGGGGNGAEASGASSSAAADVDARVGRVRMSNASGRMPCFSAAPVACVQAPSHALHPLYFHAQAALSLAPAAAAPQPQLQAARRMPAATLPRRRARHVSTNAAAAATNTAAGTSTGAHSSSRSAAGAAAAAAAAADPVVRARLGDSDDDDDGADEGGARAADAGADAVVAVAANDEELALLAEQQSDGEDSAAPPPPLPRLPAAVVGPSVTEQLEYFQRHLGCKRLSSSMSSSGSGELDAPAHAVSAAEFESEALNDVPEDLLAGLLQEDERLRQREMMEDLTGERLLTLQVARSHVGRDAASANAASAAAASTAASPATSISLALFPTGALMEELALAELSFHSIDADVIGSGGGGGGGGGSSMATPLLQVTQLHSTPLDSTIRQLCLTTPVPAPPSADLSRPQLPAAMPLIVSRTTCQMFVHTITFDPAAASSAAAAASASAGADSGAAPAAPAFASLLALDSHCFTSPIVHMCANPWLPSEVAFLLQDASIWLWNMQELSHERIAQLQRRGAASASNEGNDGARAVASMSLPKRRLTHIPVSRYWHPSLGHSILLPPLPWGRICFTPHARSLVLVLQQGAVQVDIRAPYATSRASRALAPARGKLVALPALDLSRQQLFSMAQLREVDERSAVTPRLYAASVSPANPFHLALVSSDFLMLVDVRAPSVPLIEWRHHQGGEPPTHIEWLDDRHKCATCSPHDAYFLTHNRVRNEVTLYHYTFSDVAVGIGIGDGHHSQPGPLSCVASTLHSSFTPLRLPSLVHTEQRQRQRQSASGSVSDAALDMPNPLVGVRAVADPRLPASVGLWHLLQLSEYGALVSQAFQHRHDDASDVDVATIVPIQMPPDAAVVPADAGAPAAAAESDEASGMDIDDGSEASSIAERKYRGGSSAAATTAAAATALSKRAAGAAAASDDESMAPSSPSKARASLHVLLPSTPTSSVGAAGLSASPSPQSSPPSLAALLATPERYERPWVQKHEIKPYRAVNLRAMLQDIDVGPKGDAAVAAGGAGAGAGAEAGPGALDSGPPMSLPVATTFAHLLALLIPALNGAHELVRGYLALPKTLSELTHFLLDQGLVPAQVLAALAPQALAQAPPDGSEAPLPRSRDLSAPSLHAVAQLVSECMHAFVHAAAYGLQSVPAHMPFHRERWDALLPALLASQPAATSAARKRRRNLKISASQSREDDGDAHGHGQGPAIEPLNPFAPSFPQPIFPVFHVHLALSRFAHHHAVAPSNGTVEEEDSASLPSIGRKRSASAAAAAPAQCTCGTQSLVGDASCCCVPLCACLHCMRLHATLFTTSPTVLHTPWPHERAAASAAAAAAFADTQPDASQPSWSQVSASPSAPMCVSSFLTPAKHASFGGSRGAASLGPVADLSQDIDFLMSQGTEGEADPMATQPLPFGSQDDSDAMDDKLDIKRRMADSKKPLAMGAGAGDGSDAPAPGGGVMFAVAEGEEGNGEAAADEEGGGAAAAQPADPNGVLDMLCGMGESWRQYADILQEATAAGVSGAAAASAPPSAAAAAGVAEASAQLAAREADLSEWNASLFRGWLVSHELAPDPAAMALAAAQMAEDTRGATLDTMEDPVRDDPDD